MVWVLQAGQLGPSLILRVPNDPGASLSLALGSSLLGVGPPIHSEPLQTITSHALGSLDMPVLWPGHPDTFPRGALPLATPYPGPGLVTSYPHWAIAAIH